MERMFSLGPRIVRPRGCPAGEGEHPVSGYQSWSGPRPLTLESNSVQVVEDNFLELLVDLLLLPEDDITLALDGTRFEFAALKNVGNNLDTLANVLSERLGVVHGLFPRRVGVEVRAQVLHLELQLVL